MVRLALFSLALLSGCSVAAHPRCFPADTALPGAATLRAAKVGGSVRDLGEALLAGDVARARALLGADPALARARVGARDDMTTLALAGCTPAAIDLVLKAGAPADGIEGKGRPLALAVHANDPVYAQRLLAGGASANPRGAPLLPIGEAIATNSIGAVTLLLDHRADPDAMAPGTGKRALHVALDMERFRIAELLLARGADPFAIDATGANLGTGATAPMLTDSREEAAAQARLRARLPALGWPDPAPTPPAIRDLALDGAWPPAGARGAGRVPPAVLAAIAAGTKATRH